LPELPRAKILTRLGFTSIGLESIIKIYEAYQRSFDATLCSLGETDIRLIDIPCTQSIVVDGVGGLSELEKKKLLDRASGLDRIILLLLFETGLQIDDLIGARVSDLNIKEGTLLIRTSGDEKKIAPGVLAELMSYLRMRPGQVYLLEGRCGKPITAKWKRCVLDKMLA
jgi:integrase